MVSHTGYYVYKNDIFYTQSPVDFEYIDQHELVKRQLLGVAKTKFDKFNILSCGDDFGKDIIVVLALDNGQIIFNDLDINFNLNFGDAILFFSNIKYEINIGHNLYKFAYTDKKEIFGNGDKMFEVVATIKDQYKLKIYANNSKDAITQANRIPISEWEHPDIEPHLEDRQIIRHARWGNLAAIEVTDGK
jgi:hypothetical protein